jgi:hypothetical protein
MPPCPFPLGSCVELSCCTGCAPVLLYPPPALLYLRSVPGHGIANGLQGAHSISQQHVGMEGKRGLQQRSGQSRDLGIAVAAARLAARAAPHAWRAAQAAGPRVPVAPKIEQYELRSCHSLPYSLP